MTRDQAVTLLLSRLGNRSASEYTQPILDEMDDIQRFTLEADATLVPWFLLSETSSAAFTVGEERLEVPSDFIQEYDYSPLQVLDPNTTEYVYLIKDEWDSIYKKYKDSDPGLPEMYGLVGQYFRVRPIPDVAYSAKLIYFAQQALPSAANVENTWLKYAGDLLLALTGQRIAELHLQDMDLARKFEKQAQMARARLHVQNEARMQAAMQSSMGDD